MAGLSVGERLKNLKQRMEKACLRSGRDPSSVHLLAVSKLQPVEKIQQALACGQIDFAENYAQEALLKQAELEDVRLQWHFIGRIQSNKVRMMANRFSIIHSVDRFSIAHNLNQLTRGNAQDIFLQFNVADEDSKGGASELELENLLLGVAACENLRILGLMVMPPPAISVEQARAFFAHARELMAKLHAQMSEPLRVRHPMDQLSMGTSGDFETAIEEGATWIRIGTEVFGPRLDGDEELQ